MDSKTLLAIVGVVLTFVASVPYIQAIVRKEIKPHLITWLIWTILASTGCVIQIIGGGKYGAAVLGATAALNLIILILCLHNRKDTNITKLDIAVLCLAALAFVLWRITSSPELAAGLLIFTIAMGYIPTFRKSVDSPNDEKISLYFWSGIKQIIGIAALASYNFLTLAFPISLIIANFSLVLLLDMRRQKQSAIR